MNPSDPSLKENSYQGIAHAGYAANAQVFADVRPNGSLRNWGGWWLNSVARLPNTFADGTSNTIIITEKYARCNATRSPALDWNGTWWDYGWNYQPWYLGMAVFACDYFGTYPYAIGPSSKFQVTPLPWTTAPCDPALAQAPRPGGILALLGDASTRMVASGISNTTWWAACTPAGNETLGPDW